MENKALLIGSIIARVLLLICFAVALLALLWGSKSIYFYELIGFSLISITSLAVALLPSQIFKKLGHGKYLAICVLGVLSVAIMAAYHSSIYDLPFTNYVEDLVAIVCFVYMGFYARTMMTNSNA